MLELREYQIKVIEELRNSISKGNKKLIGCLPTGAGKTVIFTYMVWQHILKGGKPLILTDRIELLKQANGSFSKFGLNPELIIAGKEPDLTKQLHVAMIETICRRAEKYSNFIASRTMVIIDEAHRSTFEKLFPFISKETIVIGFTATPYRESKQSSLSDFYTDLIQTIDTPDLIQLGFLSNAITYGVDIDLRGVKKRGGDYDSEQMGKIYGERKIYEGVIENYNRICPGTKALLFAPNISSSKEMCNQLISAGLPAMHLDSEMDNSERERILNKFKITPYIILCNVGILTTGFDCADIQTIILYRATTSLPLFLQMIGRGSRIITGIKSKFIILDFGNNIKAHNFWEVPRVWSLNKKEKKLGVPPIKTCPECGAMVPASQMKCLTPLPNKPFGLNFPIPITDDNNPIQLCQYIWVKSEKEEQEKEFAELKLLTKSDRMQIAKNADIKKKAAMAKAKLVSPYWLLHRMDNKNEAREFIKEMNYKPQFEYQNKKYFKVFQDE